MGLHIYFFSIPVTGIKPELLFVSVFGPFEFYYFKNIQENQVSAVIRRPVGA